MRKSFLYIILAGVLAAITITVCVYGKNFGNSLSVEHVRWGEFGDYFGGILNPIFALFAFLGVLWSLDIQFKQVGQLAKDRRGEEILVVVKDIDSRIHEILQENIGSGQWHSQLCIHHMLSEYERGNYLQMTDSCFQFFVHAREAGTMVESKTRALKKQVELLTDFLRRYPTGQNDGYAPIVEYYIRKNQTLAGMLNEISPLQDDLKIFYSSE